jgi:FemAB-related protein (PEP-CTERM system-associated)
MSPGEYSAWEEFVAKNTEGGPYLSSAWKKAIEQAYGFKTFYLTISENSDIQGGLPLSLVKRPYGGKLVSLPYCDYGGILGKRESTTALLCERARILAETHKVQLEIRCSTPSPYLEQCSDFVQVSNKKRMLLELSGTSEELWKGFKSKLRSQINGARKKGLTVQLGGLKLLNDYYQVISQNMRDIGSPVHSQKWFHCIVKGYDSKALVGVVYNEKIPIAAGIILMHGDVVTIPWASSLRKYNRLSSNMLLYWTFLEYSAEHEFSFFDFGRSTPGEGTYNFKKQWGAKPVPLAWYRLGAGVSLDQQNKEKHTLRHVTEKVWSRLPLPMANFLGSRLRKYIDL